jgi:hypothetical protein
MANKALSVVEPEKAVQVSAKVVESPKQDSAASAEPIVETKIYEFVKNCNPSENIEFKDGTKFKFPAGKTLFVTADESLANKILEVADRYSIFTR